MNAASYLAEQLTLLGTSHVFVVRGSEIDPILHALPDARAQAGPVCSLATISGFSAGAMADGYARVSNRLGAVAVPWGNAALDLVPALAQAYAARVPLLALIGEPPTTDALSPTASDRRLRTFEPVSSYTSRVTSARDLPRALSDAIGAARRAARPAVLLLPRDVQDASPVCTGRSVYHLGVSPCSPIGTAAALLRASVRRRRNPPVVIVGPEVARRLAHREVRELVRLLGAYVAVTPDAKDAFDNHDARFVGVLGTADQQPLTAIQAADTVVVVGTPLPAAVRSPALDEALAAMPTVVRVGDDSTVVREAVRRRQRGLRTATLHADCKRGLATLLERLRAERSPAHRRPALPAFTPRRRPGNERARFPARALLESLNELIPDHATVCTDAGDVGALAIDAVRVPRRGAFVASLGARAHGHSFGAAIGAAVASGGPAIAVAGEHAFFLHGLEIQTAIDYRLPVLFLTIGNRWLRRESHPQLTHHAPDPSLQGQRLREPPRLARLAGAVATMFPSLPIRDIVSLAELRASFAKAVRGAGPVFLSVEAVAAPEPAGHHGPRRARVLPPVQRSVGQAS